MLMMTSPTDPLLDINAVAKMLNVSIRTVYTLVSKGEFPTPVKVGAASRWDPDDVRKWIDQRKAS